jgi:hypothetical protein
MENPEKPPRPEARLKNLDPAEHEFLWDLRFKDERGLRLHKKLSAIQPEIALRYGFTVSQSTLSLFYVWLRNRRNWEQAAAIADQAKEEWLKDNPEATPEELLKVGQIQFTAQAMVQGDTKGFVQLMRAITARETAATNREKAADARLSKVEAGLDAMHAEIKENPAALKAFAALKEALKR